MPLRIYLDESVPTAIADGLRRHGIDAWSVRDAGNRGLDDSDQLVYAAQEHAVLFTHDDDFFQIANEWEQEGREHWGILFAESTRHGIGECILRLRDHALILDPDEMRNQVDFL